MVLNNYIDLLGTGRSIPSDLQYKLIKYLGKNYNAQLLETLLREFLFEIQTQLASPDTIPITITPSVPF